MFKIYNHKNNKREHKIIKKILHKGLKPYENLLPDFRIIIW